MVSQKNLSARPRQSGKWRITLIAALVAGVALPLAGCGKNNDPAVPATGTNASPTGASVNTGASPGAQGGGDSNGGGTGVGGSAGAWTVQFAKCMRAHGVPNFPDPNGRADQLGPASGVDPGSAVYMTALNGPCQSLAPPAWLSSGKDSVPGGGS